MNTLKNPKSVAELNIERTAKIIKNGLENGTSPLIPDGNGQIKFDPIVNANNGFVLSTRDLLLAQSIKNVQGYESNVVASYGTLNKCGTQTVPGAKSNLYISFRDKLTGDYKSSAYFFPEQTIAPEKVQNYLPNVQKEIRKEKNLNFEENLFGARNRFDLSDKTITITSSEPKEYLSAYTVAQKRGAKVSVSPEIFKEFSEKMIDLCNLELKNLQDFHKDRENGMAKSVISSVMFEADKQAVEKASDLEEKQEKEQSVAEPQKSFQQSRNEEMSYE